jgi:hypothetical protein
MTRGAHPAIKEWLTCPTCGKDFLSRGIANHMKTHKQQSDTKEMDTMFTVDVVALITRISNLEEETRRLRESLKAKEDALRTEIAEVQQSVFDQIPTLKNERLVIETSNDRGQTVYAEVKTEQIIQAEAEQ